MSDNALLALVLAGIVACIVAMIYMNIAWS